MFDEWLGEARKREPGQLRDSLEKIGHRLLTDSVPDDGLTQVEAIVI